MADAFAPQLSSEVRFNQPVETPSALGALADLAGGFARSFGKASETGRSVAPKTDPNLSVFQQGLERVEAIRNEKGEAAAQIAERQLASNFAAQGVSFGKEYEDVYTTTTGRPWTGYGQDVEATMLQETLKDPKVQALYIASYAVNKDWTDEQRVEYAIGQQAQLVAQENEIIRSKSEAGYKWSTQSEAAYIGAVDTFVNTTFGSLAASAAQGASAGPQEIANLQAQWSQMKFQLSRPAGITDDQWKATEEKIKAVDNAFTAFEKASSNETLASEIASAFANTMLKEGGGSAESALAALTALKDPATLTNLMGGSVETFMMEASKDLNLQMTTPNLFGHIAESQGTLVEPDPNALLTDVPSDVAQRIEGKTPQEIFDGLNASGQLSGVVKPQDLNRVEARQQFTENAATIGSVLMKNPEGDFLSADFIKKLVGNPQFIANVKALDTIDPESATVARTYVRSGLSTEKARQQRNLEAIESNLGVMWNGSTYVLDSKALMQKNGWTQQQADGFVAWVGKTYGGDLSKLAKGLVPMPEGMPFQPAGLNQAFERRSAIGVIDQTMKALEVPAEAQADGQAARAEAAATTATQTTGGYRIPEEVAQDQEFIGAVNNVASEFNVSSDDIFRVIEFETAGSWSPAIKNPGSTATGLIQFLESTAKGLGTTTAELAGMTRAQQMEYVRRYLEPYKGKIKNFGDLYLAIHYPRAVGQSETFVMYSQGSAEYAANKNLDTNGDGTVTRGETVASVIARTGGGRGVMTTPATAQTGEFLTAATGDIAAVAPPGGFAPAASPAPTTTEIAPAQTEAATAELPVDFSNAATGVMPQEEQAQAQAPAVDAEVQDLINNLSPKTKRQLRLAGIEPNEVKFYQTEDEAQAAIEAGELVEGMAFVLPDGSVRLVEGE